MVYFRELLAILNEMSPYLLLGFFISGLLHVYVPRSLYKKFLSPRGWRSIFAAAALGVPIPLCSCGVIPTAASIHKEGASAGATVSFLIATPQTGVDSLLATYSILGLPFAIIRAVASFFVAIFAGGVVDSFAPKREGKKGIDYSGMRPTTSAPSTATDAPSCSCGCSHTATSKRSFRAALRYGFHDMMQDFGLWLIVGLLAAAAITAFVPDSFFALFHDNYILSILIVLVISTPMYICATGSIPIALSLILKGLSPGAAFVLLLAGPATNIASLVILKREIGGVRTLLYLASIMVGAVASALVIDLLLPSEWFTSLTPITTCAHEHHNHEMCSHGPIWWQTLCSITFIALFVRAIISKYAYEKIVKNCPSRAAAGCSPRS